MLYLTLACPKQPNDETGQVFRIAFGGYAFTTFNGLYLTRGQYIFFWRSCLVSIASVLLLFFMAAIQARGKRAR